MSIELLAPAGELRSFYAAINASCNAVYLGMKKYGARAYSANFDVDEIIELVKYAHLRNVKVYVTVNTLINNMTDLIKDCDTLYLNGVDAFIVQDLGAISFFVERYKDMAIHASTQVNAHEVAHVKFLKSLGVKRVILARETSIDVIKRIKKEVDIELEVFIHGALCMSYSGECLFSSLIYNRSGNKGECAQPCRMMYKLDDKEGYLLSTKDLMTLDYLDELLPYVDSLKIEGRMKRPEYVYLVTKIYRDALNKKITDFDQVKQELKTMFNREFTKGYLFNEQPINIANTYRPNNLGVKIGKVISVSGNDVKIKLIAPLHRLDGIRIIGKNDYGFTIDEMKKDNKKVEEAFKDDVVIVKSKERVEVSSDVVLTSSYVQLKEINNHIEENIKIPVDVDVYIKYGKSLEMAINGCKVYYDYPLEKAKNIASTIDDVKKQIIKFGDTPYEVKNINIEMDDFLFVPIKVLNELRRIAINNYYEEVLKINRKIYSISYKPLDIKQDERMLTVEAFTLDQVKAALDLGIEEVYYQGDYNDTRVRKKVGRIITNEDVKSDFIAVNETSELLSNKNIVTLPYLNVNNAYTVNLLHSLGVKRVSLSLELNKMEIEKIIYEMKNTFHYTPNLELMVYGRAELMVMKHCPISKKGLYCNECKKKDFYLSDRKDYLFPIKTDKLCNAYLLNSKVLNLIDYVNVLYKLGVNSLNLSFVTEGYEETKIIISEFQKAQKNEAYDLIGSNYTYGGFNR